MTSAILQAHPRTFQCLAEAKPKRMSTCAFAVGVNCNNKSTIQGTRIYHPFPRLFDCHKIDHKSDFLPAAPSTWRKSRQVCGEMAEIALRDPFCWNQTQAKRVTRGDSGHVLAGRVLAGRVLAGRALSAERRCSRGTAVEIMEQNGTRRRTACTASSKEGLR